MPGQGHTRFPLEEPHAGRACRTHASLSKLPQYKHGLERPLKITNMQSYLRCIYGLPSKTKFSTYIPRQLVVFCSREPLPSADSVCLLGCLFASQKEPLGPFFEAHSLTNPCPPSGVKSCTYPREVPRKTPYSFLNSSDFYMLKETMST